jgi:hypothetical protein
MITESSRIDFLVNKYIDTDDLNQKLTDEELFSLIVADPETKIKTDIDIDEFEGDFTVFKKVGPYSQWIIRQYLSIKPEIDEDDKENYRDELKKERNLFWENLYKINDDLLKFHRFKSNLPQGKRDINKLSVSELAELMLPFSLEKKVSNKEKVEAKKTFEFPGSEVIFRGKNWTVVKIEDKGYDGKKAADFFGGYGLKSGVGETNWCTAAPGSKTQFDHYINKGPLFVIIPQEDVSYGEKTGLPANRYQFSFETNNFMDKDDRPIDVQKLLNGPMKELKPLFRKEFGKSLMLGSSNEFSVKGFKHGPVGMFISLYGFDEIFEALPDSVTEIYIQGERGEDLDLVLPDSISKFKNLKALMVTHCLSKVSDNICNLNELKYVGFPDNPNLKEIPECIGDLPKLKAISLVGQKMNLPTSVKNNFEQERPGLFLKKTRL